MRFRMRVSTATLAVLCCFLVIGLLGVYLKVGMLHPEWGAIARFLGLNERWDLKPLARLGFYRDDLLLGVLLFPPAATALVSMVFRRYRVGVAAILCGLTSIVLFYESKAQVNVGRYVSRDFLVDSVQFALANPATAGAYVTPVDIFKLVILLLTFAGIWLISRLARRRGPAPTRQGGIQNHRLLLASPIIVTALLLLPTIPLSLAHYSPGLSVNMSSLYRVASVLLGSSETGSSGKLDFDQSLAAIRKLTKTPPLDAGSSLVGTERGANVLIFVMETGPAQALDLAKVGRTLPGAGQLFGNSFVASLHYTTYPYTGNAVYSIFTGMYPQGRERLLHRSRHRVITGFMSAVGDESPIERVYMPLLGTSGSTLQALLRSSPSAGSLYVSDKNLGDALHEPAEKRAIEYIAYLQRQGSRFDNGEREELQKKLTLDLQALAKMEMDIATAARDHQRFTVSFFPQIGHAPWFALHNGQSILRRGHELMLLQDRWLAELVTTLRQLGQLDNTVIVFTADHGIRTRKEDPGLPVGKISDYMFRVPLMIYAPKALAHEVYINAPSSHVDVAPTLLALLGNVAAAARMEGVPLWQRSPGNRLYFWAGAYGGADGFEESGSYFMRQEMSDAEFRSDYEGFYRGFPDDTFLGLHDPAYGPTKTALEQAQTLQETIVSRWMVGEPGH